MAAQRVLILGATGFVGQRLLARLRSAASAAPFAFEGRVDSAALSSALARADAVVNCTLGKPAAILRAAQALFTAAGERPLRRVVQLGSMTVYGAVTGHIDERQPPGSALGAYAAAQAAAEALALRHPAAVILRPGVEYGPGCTVWGERVARWLLARRIGDIGAAGSGTCNLIYIDDLIEAIVAALQTPAIEGQVFNLASSQPSWNEYFERYAAALGVVPVARISAARLWRETRLQALPLKAAERLARACGMPAASLPPAIPPSLPRLCRQDIRLDVGRAETRLGLRWTPLDDGLRAAAAAFLARP